jgi:hypothetical protein
MEELGLKAVALSRDNVLLTRRTGRDIFEEVRILQETVVLLSPETFLKAGMSNIMRNQAFRVNLLNLGLHGLPAY